MYGRVRCLCGRFMKLHHHEPATHASGGRSEYRCSRCGAVAMVWSMHCTDDMPFVGAIWSADDRVRGDLGWLDESHEWRFVSLRFVAA
jgi:hypothetical protein